MEPLPALPGPQSLICHAGHLTAATEEPPSPWKWAWNDNGQAALHLAAGCSHVIPIIPLAAVEYIGTRQYTALWWFNVNSSCLALCYKG